jgi:hypothetical protein
MQLHERFFFAEVYGDNRCLKKLKIESLKAGKQMTVFSHVNNLQ